MRTYVTVAKKLICCHPPFELEVLVGFSPFSAVLVIVTVNKQAHDKVKAQGGFQRLETEELFVYANNSLVKRGTTFSG